MNRTDDVHRSLRRWIAAVLGDEWTVKAEEGEVPDDARPLAYVEVTTPVTTPVMRTSIPQGDVQKRQSYSVQCYPSTEGIPRETRKRADDLVDVLDRAVTIGALDPGPPEEMLGGPGALPLYDYAGVPVTGADRAGPADAYAYADVESHGVQAIRDPLDDRRWTVVLDLRLSWWSGGRIRRFTPAPPAVASTPIHPPLVD